MTEKVCFGVDIGGTKIAVSVGRKQAGKLEIIDKKRFMTVPRDPDANIAAISETLLCFAAQYGDPMAIGIACGGPLDIQNGVVLNPPNLPGWDDVHIVDALKALFACPISIENDAEACALAEFQYGAGVGTTNMIFLTFGTGLGAGLILNGQLYHGSTNSAGEVGHIRLAPDGPVGYFKAGSFEGFCSGGGIQQLARMIIDRRIKGGTATDWAVRNGDNIELSAKTVAEAAAAGDDVALETMAACGQKFGEGLSILIDILNPDMIVVGSIFVRSGELLAEAMHAAIAREALASSAAHCKIVPAKLDENIGDYAALSIAFNLI